MKYMTKRMLNVCKTMHKQSEHYVKNVIINDRQTQSMNIMCLL